MPALHIRNLDDAVIAGLKARAARTDQSHRGAAKPRLRLRTVRVGQNVTYTRDIIYDDRGR